MSVIKMFPQSGVSLTAEKAEGTRIFTKEYGMLVDLESGCWAAVLGHCRKEIVKVISENSALLFHTHQLFDTEHPAALAKEITLAAELKGSYKGTFLSSGSEAVSLAVKLSELLSGRSKKLCLAISYLGSSSELKMPRNPEQWLDLTVTDCLGCKKNTSCNECGKFNKIDFKQIAAFVFEPGNSGGLVLCPPEKLIDFLSDNVRKAGGFIVVNEVTTGFGRTGKWFGFQYYQSFDSEENSPDFIAMGKGLGNGYPISGVLVKSKLVEAIEVSHFKYVQSHIDDPLGCIIARKVVEIMVKDQLVERGNKTGEYFRYKLAEVAESSGGISEIRGRGMMNVLILKETFKAKNVFIELLKQGFFTGYSEAYNFIHLYAPLTLENDNIDKFCLSLKHIFKVIKPK